MRPTIGITTSLNDGEQRLSLNYVRAVEQAGGVPWIVPMVVEDHLFDLIADQLDALIVTGGPAVTEGLIGTLPHDIGETAPHRSVTDREILSRFLSTGRPILGICYGMQLLNALAGGTIYADVEAQVEGSAPHSQKRNAPIHPIHIEEKSHLARIFPDGMPDVNTRHIQAVAEVGDPYRVCATAPDGVIEGIEHPDGHIIGLQFHPERMGQAMRPLFEHLISLARSAKSAAVL